jgi:FtsZ-binding cell division protein ZapB
MQKIRNRISAQESRDRKKNQFNELVNNNISLIKNSMNMKRQIDELQRENMALKSQVTLAQPQITASHQEIGDLTHLKNLFTSKGRLHGKSDWKSFSLFMLTMVIYCVLYPDQSVLKDKLLSEEFHLSSEFS